MEFCARLVSSTLPFLSRLDVFVQLPDYSMSSLPASDHCRRMLYPSSARCRWPEFNVSGRPSVLFGPDLVPTDPTIPQATIT